jgi:hypothetical protein
LYEFSKFKSFSKKEKEMENLGLDMWHTLIGRGKRSLTGGTTVSGA